MPVEHVIQSDPSAISILNNCKKDRIVPMIHASHGFLTISILANETDLTLDQMLPDVTLLWAKTNAAIVTSPKQVWTLHWKYRHYLNK